MSFRLHFINLWQFLVGLNVLWGFWLNFAHANVLGLTTSLPEKNSLPAHQQHVAATVRGPINPANWSLKRDYESLLDANGWTRQQLTVLSTVHQILYFDQSNIQPARPVNIGNVRSTATPSGEGNVTSHFSQSCPHNVTLQFTALGQDIRLYLTLNKYLHSPILQVKTIAQTDTDMTTIKTGNDCYYQSRDPESFGTFAIDLNGHLRAFLDTGGQNIVITPLSAPSSTDTARKDWRSNSINFRHPHLLFVPKSQIGSPISSGCGLYHTSSAKHGRHKERNSQRGGRMHRRRRSRSPRDIRFQFKWIELGLIFDSSMLNLIKMNRHDPVEVALHLTNLLDQIYQPLKTRVILTYLELWTVNNQIHMTREASSTLLNLMSYSTENLFSAPFDSLQLITASTKGFLSEEFGTASTNSVCTLKSIGIVHNGSPSLNFISLAVKVSHMIAHNLGIHHDFTKGRDCICPKDDGCLMNTFLKQVGGGPPIFSSCSQDDYLEALHMGQGVCLLTSPFHKSPISATCGDGVVDSNENCDCGGFVECLGKAPCCDPITCLFKDGAECAGGPCCTTECKFKKEGSLCREADTECDLPEYCTGSNGSCPSDGFKKTGYLCQDGASYCYNRSCVSHDDQCQEIWGAGSTRAASECYKYFQQDLATVCDDNKAVQCPPISDLLCGSVQCQGGSQKNLSGIYSTGFSAAITIMTMNGKQFECKIVTSDGFGEENSIGINSLSLRVKNGAKCGTNQVCIDGQCTDIIPFQQSHHCPTNNRAIICSGHGTCDDFNRCSCYPSFVGPDCSRHALRSGLNNHTTDKDHLSNSKRTLLLDGNKRSLGNEIIDNFMMLIIMASLIALFLLIFLFALLCYKRTSSEETHPELTDFYTESDQSGGSYDVSPLAVKPNIPNFNHYLPNGVEYVEVPTHDYDLSNVLFTCIENNAESEETMVRDVQLDSMYPSPQIFHPMSKKDAAVSPFIRQKHSIRWQRSQQTPEDCLSAPETGPENPLTRTFTDLTHMVDYGSAAPGYANQPNSHGRIRIKNFEQLLQQLDSDCQTDQRSLPNCRRTNTIRSWGTGSDEKPRIETKDADCQVNLDTEERALRVAADGVPSPMQDLNLPRVMSEINRDSGKGNEEFNSNVWQPRRPSIRELKQPVGLTSPQRRRPLTRLRRKERQGTSQANLDLSTSDSDLEEHAERLSEFRKRSDSVVRGT